MSIREVTGEGIPAEPIKPKKSGASESAKEAPNGSKDRVELSGEARSLYEADQVRRYEQIRQKLESGFYNSREVAEKVVDALLADLKRSAS
jgi:anti-sigma28 factor (negative regulator of flagellin synthesis)